MEVVMNGLARVAQSTQESLFALDLLVMNHVCLTILDKASSSLDEIKRYLIVLTLLAQTLYPLIVARSCSVIVFTST